VLKLHVGVLVLLCVCSGAPGGAAQPASAGPQRRHPRGALLLHSAAHDWQMEPLALPPAQGSLTLWRPSSTMQRLVLSSTASGTHPDARHGKLAQVQVQAQAQVETQGLGGRGTQLARGLEGGGGSRWPEEGVSGGGKGGAASAGERTVLGFVGRTLGAGLGFGLGWPSLGWPELGWSEVSLGLFGGVKSAAQEAKERRAPTGG